MSRELKRQIGYGAVLALCVAGVGFAAGFKELQAAFAVVSLLALCVYVVRSDEVERWLSYRAAAFAFVIALASSMVVEHLDGVFAAGLPVWALLMAAFLVSWTILRIRLG